MTKIFTWRSAHICANVWGKKTMYSTLNIQTPAILINIFLFSFTFSATLLINGIQTISKYRKRNIQYIYDCWMIAKTRQWSKIFFFYYNIKQNNMKYLKTFLIILEKKFAYKSSKWRRNKEKYWNKLCKSHNIIFNSGI